jgi:hypothetical protein
MLAKHIIKLCLSKFSTFIIAALLFTSCKKHAVDPPIVKPIITKIDYRKYELNGIASASGSSISDTIWDGKKEKIIGFKLKKWAIDEFQYPVQNFQSKPLINSFVSLKDFPKLNIEAYRLQSNTLIPRMLVTTYEPGYYVNYIKVGTWGQMDSIIRNRVSQLVQDRTESNDFVFNFHNYENLKLLFEEDVDIKKLFKIPSSDYPNLKNIGKLYYKERSTVNLRALFENRDFTDYFPMQKLMDENITRVARVRYGKIGYMVLDAPEETKLLINKALLQNGKNELTDSEIARINESKVYCFLRGYTQSDVDRINQSSSALDKIIAFNKVTEVETYTATNIGIPMYFKLDSHYQTTDLFKSTNYVRQINFIQ